MIDDLDAGYIQFNVFSYKGDKYSETYDDIVNINNEHAINTSNKNYNTCFALPIDKIVTTLSDTQNESTLSAFSNTNVLWDFGDGTTSTDLSAVHWYQFPGKYRISLTVFDVNLSAFISKYSTIVHVYNYIPQFLDINASDQYTYTYGDVVDIQPLNLVDNENFTTGILPYLDTPYFEFNLRRFNSWQSFNVLSSIGYDVSLYVEGCNAPIPTVDEYNSNSYAHLSCYSKILDTDNQLVTRAHFDILPSDCIYVNYDSSLSSFVSCQPSDNNATLVGTIGNKRLKFTDDMPVTSGNQIQIAAVFETSGFKTKDNVNSDLNQQWYNQTPYVFTFTNILTTLSTITTCDGILNVCGLSGEQYNIFDYKLVDTPINFVFALTFTPQQYICKYEQIINVDTHGNLFFSNTPIGKISVLVPNTSATMVSDIVEFIPTSSIGYGGYLKSQVIFHQPISNVSLQVSVSSNTLYTQVDNNPISSNILYFQSNVFDVVSSTSIALFKQNENFDLANTYKSFGLQPILRESESLFNDIFEPIVGDNTNYNNFGVRLYEKISNFVDNTQDVDTCNIAFLYDMYNKFDEYIADLNYNWPSELQRDIDLLSIKFDKLRGFKNQFNSDFDKKGYISNKKYGKNLGDEIDFCTGVISTDETIIAYEKFSEKYTKLNCNISTNYISAYMTQPSSTTFYLSGFGEHSLVNDKIISNTQLWGWCLVLPTQTTVNIPDYYKFYRFIPIADGEYLNSVIDWSNEHTTLSSQITNMSLDEWNRFKKAYIMQTIINGLNT